MRIVDGQTNSVKLQFNPFILHLFQVGHLKKGLNPPSIQDLNFDPQYLPLTLKAGIVSGILALAVRTLEEWNFNLVSFRPQENGHRFAI